MAYFPMFVDLTDKTCLVVGGGEVAYRKVKTLLDFDAKVTVVAESVCPRLAGLAGARNVTSENKMLTACGQDAEKADVLEQKSRICVRPFQKEDCDGRLLVVAATDDKELNHNIKKNDYNEVIEYAINLGIKNCYCQLDNTNKKKYIPNFNLEGVKITK